MAFCPNVSKPTIVENFNKLLVNLGGNPMTIEEFKDKDKRSMRPDIKAIDKAYYIWDKSEGKVDENGLPNDELMSKIKNELQINTINTQELIEAGEITYTDENGNPCAGSGGRNKSFTKGGKWSLVEDLKGMPKHSEGGVNLNIENGKVHFARNNSKIHAKEGLLIPNIK